MSTRRLAAEQPEHFAFSPENLHWAKGQIAKFPDGRQASAVIPLLWRAQEQEGWVSKPAIETISHMLDMPEIRVLEVATFYFMFKLAPVGSVAHFEICGTTPCMLCGSEELVEVCKRRISPKPFAVSADGKFSWEEVECLGACSNAPMIQIGKDYYEDLDAARFEALLDGMAAWSEGRGEKPRPGSAKGRFASEPLGGLTSLYDQQGGNAENASVALATGASPEPRAIPGGVAVMERAQRLLSEGEEPAPDSDRPQGIERPTDGGDDLKRIKGVGPQLEALLNDLGYYTFAQIAGWSRDNVRWVDQHLAGFRGRIDRDDWVAQAKALAAATSLKS
ncbi:MAG: NADH-quinone oxidoreductase subunit NuoE [Neomegalonema sp.]|nr:NADH-quinone oxidoreductase subunit NuoE [Neomegalonema sp.]